VGAVTRSELRAGGRELSPYAVFVGVALVVGLAMRVALYRSSLSASNSDEAVLGLMVRHALHGQFTTFLWGADYGGTQEVLLTVPVFWLVGSGVNALRVVPLALNVITALLVWRVGRRTLAPRPAVVAGALYWVWPPQTVFLQLHQVGFYASNGIYSALILLAALRARERASAARVALLGLVIGLAFWQTSQIVPVAVPAVAWLVWRERRVLRHAWLAVPLAVLGALPWIVWNASHGWASLHFVSGSNSSYLFRLRTFASPVLPMALGLRQILSQAWLAPYGIAALAYVGLLVLFCVGAYRGRRRDVSLLYVVAAVFPLVMMISPVSFQTIDPRYVTALLPVLALLVAQLATTWARAWGILVLACLVTATWLHDFDRQVQTVSGGQPNAPRSIAPLISTLERLHVDRAYADYWVAYRLAFDTNERIVAVENQFDDVVDRDGDVVPLPDPKVRFRDYDLEVRRGRHAFVFFRGWEPGRPFLAKLTAHGYSRHDVQNFVVYAPPR